MEHSPAIKKPTLILTDVRGLYRQAVDHHQRGRFQEAIAGYDRVIAAKPNHAGAHANRAFALSSVGRHAEALANYDRAIASKPNDAGLHSSLGRTLYALGRHDEAIAACDRAIVLEPGNAELHRIRGYMLRAAGRQAEALASYDRAVALKSDFTQAHCDRGNTLRHLGRFEEALAAYDRVIALKPDHIDAHNNRGVAANALGHHSEALVSYERAIALEPEYADAYSNLGNTLNALGRHSEAVSAFDRAIALKPNDPDAHKGRAKALDRLDRHDDALASYDRAIELKPDDAEAHCSRGVMLRRLGRYDKALESIKRAIAADPSNATAQFSRALLLLAQGNYEDGLESYEWRWRCAFALKPRGFTQPQWRGEPIADKTILLHVEQGAGDTIQMLRYLPLVKAKAARVILQLPKAAQPLLGPMAEGVVVIDPGSPLPSFDVHCPEMSLPLALGTRVDTVPAQIPYLMVPTERAPIWRTRLPKSASPRIGLVWSGNAAHSNDHNRSIALDRLAPLLNISGVSFVSLQREYRDGDLSALTRLPIERIDDAIRDFGDTAAAIDQCDLVISVDTAVAHLAGSLGKPLWLLLPYVPDWRWLLDRADSPWYPTARLFRQTGVGDWESVIATVVNELSVFAEEF